MLSVLVHIFLNKLVIVMFRKETGLLMIVFWLLGC